MPKKDPFTLEHATVAVLLGWLVWFFMFRCYFYNGFRELGIQGGYGVGNGDLSGTAALIIMTASAICSSVPNALMAYLTAKTSTIPLKISLYIATFSVVVIGPICFTYWLYINDHG